MSRQGKPAVVIPVEGAPDRFEEVDHWAANDVGVLHVWTRVDGPRVLASYARGQWVSVRFEETGGDQ